MTAELREELAGLTRALRAHLEWSAECATDAVPAADEAWIAKRREEYRRTEIATDAEQAAPFAPAPAQAEELPPRDPTPPSSPAGRAPAPAQAEEPPPRNPTPPSSPAGRAPAPAQAEEVPPRDPTPPSSPAGRAPTLPPVAQSPPRTTTPASTPAGQAATLAQTGKPAPRAAAPAAEPAPAQQQVSASEAEPPPNASSRELHPAEARRRLQVLEETVRQCTRCALHRERTQTVFARGHGSSGLVFVGEGPGAEEDAQGYPFVGKAGQLLDRMIAAMGFEREEVYVCNIVKCRPPSNRKPEAEEIAACRPFVAEQLELIQPQVVVALGATAVVGLLGVTLGITRLRGQWRLYQGRIPVMPTFHPAYLLRQPAAKRLVWEDLQQVLKQMQRPVPERR